jgi:hypothetical protein
MLNDPDFTAERPLRELASCFPMKQGKYPTTGKIRRWMHKGLRGVRLEGRRIGGEWYTSPAAIDAFIRTLNRNVTVATRPDPRKAAKVRRLLIAEGFADETPEVQNVSATS